MVSILFYRWKEHVTHCIISKQPGQCSPLERQLLHCTQNPEKSPRLDCSDYNFGVFSGSAHCFNAVNLFYTTRNFSGALTSSADNSKNFRGTHACPGISNEPAGIKLHTKFFEYFSANSIIKMAKMAGQTWIVSELHEFLLFLLPLSL